MHKEKSILNSSALYTLIAIFIGFMVGALLLILAQVSPVEAYGKLVSSVFSKPKYLIWAITYATPLIFTGLSVAFSFRMGIFNIGAEGQYVMGSLAACVVGILVDLPPVLHVILCMVAAIVAGSIWGMIVGYLKIKRGINEVLSFIMFNWIAFYFSNFIINLESIHKVGGGEASKDILPSASIKFSQEILTILGCSSANIGIFIAIIVASIIWFILKKTTLGYKICAVGYNKNAAIYGGINSNRTTLIAMGISGALAGLGGAIQLMGMSGRISQFAGQEGYGFQGITVALIGSSNPIGCIFSGFFYGAMKYGGSKLSLIDAPAEIVDIIMGTIIFFIAISHIFKHLLQKQLLKREGK